MRFSHIKFLHIGFIGVAIILFMTVFAILWPYKIIDIDQVAIVTPSIRAGEEVSFQVHYCKYLDIKAEVTSEIISIDENNNTKEEIVWLTRKATGDSEPMCSSGIVSFPTPKNLVPGNYKIRNTLRFEPNPVRIIEIQYITPSFYITNS